MPNPRNLNITARPPVHPQGRGLCATLILAGLLALAGLGAIWCEPPAAWAVPYTLGGTFDQQGTSGNLGGADGLNKTDSQAAITADRLTVSGGNGGAGENAGPTAGGNGGSASLTVTNNLTSTTPVGDAFTAGTGGPGGNMGGAGGAGGAITVDVGGDFSSAGTATFTAGAGGGGGDVGGDGGAGGAMNVDIGGDFSSADAATFTAGAGGAGGHNGGPGGGAGGAMTVDIGGDFSSAGAATFTAGAGGNSDNFSGGVGGAGGAMTVDIGGDFSSAGDATFTAGSGGASGNVGGAGFTGGAGGAMTVDIGGDFSSAGAATFSAGAGGDCTAGNHNGGAGGAMNVDIGGNFSSADAATFTAGAGGGGGDGGGDGGAGGAVALSAPTGEVHFANGFNLTAGNGGDGGTHVASPGGAGGAASISAQNMRLTGPSGLSSGAIGADNAALGGAGGAASLVIADTLTAYGDTDLTFLKRGGGLLFSADTLLLNAETNAGALANARLQLLINNAGQEIISTDIQINTLVLAGDAAQGGHSAAFSTSGGMAPLRWASDPLGPPPGNPNEFYIPHLAVRGTGNSLDVPGFTARSLTGDRGLQDMTFEITGQEAGQGPMLTVTSGPAAFDADGLADKLRIVALNALNLTKGTDKITFLRSGHVGPNPNMIDSSGKFSATDPRRYTTTFGLTDYYFDLLLDGVDLVGTYAGLTPPPVPPGPDPDPARNYKPYFEGLLGQLVTLNNSGNAIARTVDQAANLPHSDGWQILITAEGQHVRVDTGSHLDDDSLALTLALARQLENSLGALTLGAFFETGWGGYSTYNNLEHFGGVDGDGNTNFYGGGLFARQDFTCGFYAEASGRVGMVDYDFDVDDHRFDGANYDDSETYWGAHAGLGYLWQFNEANALEVYDKLFWTHVDSGETATDAHESIRYDAMDSLRNRLGARFHHDFNDQVSAYVGAAWEYEFDGAADGAVRVAGETLDLSDNPDMRGSSGLGELGLSAQPDSGMPLYIDLTVYGLVGTQEGVGGALQLKYTF